MKAYMIGCLVLLLAASSNGAKITPVQKVIQMLGGMKDKSIAQSQDADIEFAKFKTFCEGTSAEKQAAIDKAIEEIKVLKADIAQYAADASRLAQEIAGHEEDIAVWTGDMKAAKGVRAIEKADYDKTHKDYSESVDALGRAIATLKAGAKDKAQSLLQNLKGMTKHQKQVLDAFLQEEQDPLDTPVPEANAYENRSGPIIAMLQKLLDKFIDQRTTLEKEEMESVNAFELLVQDLTADLEQANTDKDSKSEAKATALQNKANSEGDLEDVTGTEAADSKYLSDMTAT
jgi:hypothetical protein